MYTATGEGISRSVLGCHGYIVIWLATSTDAMGLGGERIGAGIHCYQDSLFDSSGICGAG